jgi:hypothetical protein
MPAPHTWEVGLQRRHKGHCSHKGPDIYGDGIPDWKQRSRWRVPPDLIPWIILLRIQIDGRGGWRASPWSLSTAPIHDGAKQQSTKQAGTTGSAAGAGVLHDSLSGRRASASSRKENSIARDWLISWWLVCRSLSWAWDGALEGGFLNLRSHFGADAKCGWGGWPQKGQTSQSRPNSRARLVSDGAVWENFCATASRRSTMAPNISGTVTAHGMRTRT